MSFFVIINNSFFVYCFVWSLHICILFTKAKRENSMSRVISILFNSFIFKQNIKQKRKKWWEKKTVPLNFVTLSCKCDKPKYTPISHFMINYLFAFIISFYPLPYFSLFNYSCHLFYQISFSKFRSVSADHSILLIK